MKRKRVVLGLGLLLLVVLSSTVGVMADKGGDPHGEREHHDGGCVAYCARADAIDANGDYVEFCWRDACGGNHTTPCTEHEVCGTSFCNIKDKHGEDTHGRGKGQGKP